MRIFKKLYIILYNRHIFGGGLYYYKTTIKNIKIYSNDQLIPLDVILLWCDKNIGKENYRWHYIKKNHRSNGFDVVFSFRTEEQLVLFKLAREF